MRDLNSIRGIHQGSLESTHHHYPDLSFIKKFVPISEIAAELGLDVSGSAARCWRPENHQNGDRTPSVGFSRRKNIGKCFVCDDHAWSNVDLVQEVLGCTLREAIEWIAARFTVPQIPKGKHLSTTERWESRTRVGTSGFALENLVRSGLWASLTKSEIAALGVLLAYADSVTGIAKISYRGIMRYAGIGSFTTVSRVLRRFEKICLLQIQRTSGDDLRACNAYALTPDHPVFRRLQESIFQRQAQEIQAERQVRGEQRNSRRARRAATTGKPSLQ